MTDPFPCKGHDVVQWTFEPVAGYPHTKYWCFDCGTDGRITTGAKL